MDIIRYHDTRGLDPAHPAFTEVVIKGIARGGGLYVPDSLPGLGLSDVVGLAELAYHERAARVFRLFGVDVPEARIDALMAQAFGANFDHAEIAPVVDVAPGLHVLELWHGPTSAFKDMALQCMPRFFSEAIAMRRAAGEDVPDYLVLVATSGDTGKAALEGFADRESTRIAVFFPADGISDIQRRQMVTQRGRNVAVFGVRGNFDDCQNAVKAAFNDAGFNTELRDREHIELSSANSINWGRLLPQIVYYASAYADLATRGAVAPGDPLDVCVPTGNFGNILAAYYAKRMGVPLGRLVCASNENNVLADFIGSGVYDIAGREFVTTPSPSMDILISSNLERLLYGLCRDPQRVNRWMADLSATGVFRIDDDTFAALRDLFVGDYVSNDRSLYVIKEVFERCGYLLDPHTAVAWDAAERHRGDAPMLVVSTAHWAKFGADVYKALHRIPYGEPLPPGASHLTGLELLAAVQRLAPAEAVPGPLAEMADLPERFAQTVEGTCGGVEAAVRGWLTHA
jgi:threonine synthase